MLFPNKHWGLQCNYVKPLIDKAKQSDLSALMDDKATKIVLGDNSISLLQARLKQFGIFFKKKCL